MSLTRGRLIRGHVGGWVCLVGIVSACGRRGSPDPQDVAALHLACAPASRGVHCRLLALSHDVRLSPRDVTAQATWQLSGIAGAQISADGVIDAPNDGDVEIDTQYASRRARARVRLARDRPGQILAVVRGRIYAEGDSTLNPIAHARVEVVGGPSAGLSTTTLEDGSYELAGVVPGKIVIRATKIGYTAAEVSTRLDPGDNRVSLLIEVTPPSAASAL